DRCPENHAGSSTNDQSSASCSTRQISRTAWRLKSTTSREDKVNSKTKCLITAAGIFFGIMAAVHAKDNDEDSILCSARGLTGTYLFHASGFNISVTGVPQPKAIVEVFRFDGDGKLTGGAATVSINGTIFHSQSTAPGAGGTY